MSKNERFNEYLDSKFNKKQNYNMVYERIQKREKDRNNMLKSMLLMLVVLLVGFTGNQIYARRNWNKEYDEYVNRQIVCANTSIKEQNNNDEYVEKLDMDYIYKNGVGIKIDEVMLTEYTCRFDISFNIVDEIEKEYQAFEFGYAIYDENNNIYCVEERTKFNSGVFLNYEKKMYKELGIEYNLNKKLPIKEISNFKLNPVLLNNENKIMRLELGARKSLPKSKKLYIRIFDIGYTLVETSNSGATGLEIKDSEDFGLSNLEWQFEIDIPEKIYNRSYESMELTEKIDNINIESVVLSSEGFLKMVLDTKYRLPEILPSISICDENEKQYPLINVNDADKIELIFDVGRDNLENKLFLKLDSTQNENKKMIELKNKNMTK